MSERVAIVGSRKGVELQEVRSFVHKLWEKYPDTILVSGGATGVDQIAEQEWLNLGGLVESFRPTAFDHQSYGVEKWELGGDDPSVYRLVDHPTFEDYKSAALYRDILIADAADRVVAFIFRYSPGASFTAVVGEDYGKEVYRYRY